MHSDEWMLGTTGIVAYEPYYERFGNSVLPKDDSGHWWIGLHDPDNDDYVGGIITVRGEVDDPPESLASALSEIGFEVLEPGWADACPGVWSARIRPV